VPERDLLTREGNLTVVRAYKKDFLEENSKNHIISKD